MSAPTSRLLVFGATGYTGQSVVTLARQRKLETHAHLRPDSPSAERLLPHFEALDVKTHRVQWTPRSIAELIRSVEPTHVFSLLGTTKKKAAAHDNADYAAVDVGMTLMVVDAVAAMPKPARLVYLSSYGVNAKARGAYLKARWAVESRIRDQSRGPLKNWVIAQPSLITGPDRKEARPGERIAATVVDNLLGVLGHLGGASLRERYASMTGRELAAGLLHHGLDHHADMRTVDAAELRDPNA